MNDKHKCQEKAHEIATIISNATLKYTMEDIYKGSEEKPTLT